MIRSLDNKDVVSFFKCALKVSLLSRMRPRRREWRWPEFSDFQRKEQVAASASSFLLAVVRIHGFTISIPVLILFIFWLLLLRNRKNPNKCFETGEYSVQTTDDNSKLTSKTFQMIFKLYSFKAVLYLDTAAISNQIKYYLTTNRWNFLEMQCGFYRYALLADLLWLAVERAFTKNSGKAATWLFEALLWKIIKLLWLVKYSSNLFLLTGEAGIVNVQGCSMRWY